MCVTWHNYKTSKKMAIFLTSVTWPERVHTGIHTLARLLIFPIVCTSFSERAHANLSPSPKSHCFHWSFFQSDENAKIKGDAIL